MTVVFSFAMSGQLLCTFESIIIVLYSYEFKKFSPELTLYTRNSCEGVDRICTQKLVQEIFLKILPSLPCFHCTRFWFVGEDLWYNDQSITTPHNIALEKVNGGLWNYFGGFDYYL